ncbi:MULTISPECIES: GlsB/YeaQ/YmgE family stress response membrane protein [Sphingosinicellaceae]|jgi:uncharacterized membrane protein YeaQ/YmgE (transglycosylase-associated protein family)|uniref:GlsB/YeaQ/YmgE family stress response membrane protein n=1 Tax=Sphingosinicellaceae TaxID=2820280 RepID=UPI001C1E41BA|nr:MULTISPECIES: GlsB/YeaQ/YmgE family stress response membrane protein [Polymorphobacter]QYE36636.1 GlsB/YeaQ/YmgE family stress response membrane protein [Polymorphobacter sp. PAMC 29334]UAJ08765.1 GlsB/YeaQ/YmgE family stress response membrane protein [Polymorphobacter megasporae]
MPEHGFIGWIVVGLIVGAIAKIFTPGPSGCIATILIGIAGSLFAGWAGSHWFHLYRDGSAPGLIASVLGAVVLLAVARLVTGRN